MAIRSIGLLPEIFKTDTNQKFVNATIEQLTNEPKLNKVNGYIGRRFTSLYENSDNYIDERSRNRLNYQLEPAIAIDNKNGQNQFLAHYTDLMDKIRFYGGNTTDQTRLFSNEFYSYDAQIDYDKFVNFSQYYWLPAGPVTVNIVNTVVAVQQSITVERYGSSSMTQEGHGYYNFSITNEQQNPLLVLVRGGSYTFNLNQPGNSFWIQSNSGITGVQDEHANFSTREIWGVENNGNDDGIVTFNVPMIDAQNVYVEMDNIYDINLVADGISYIDLQGVDLDEFNTKFGGIDNNEYIDEKYIIFGDNEVRDEYWIYNSVVVPTAERTGIWQVNIVDSTIQLTYIQDIPYNNKVSVLEGTVYNSREWLKNVNGKLQVVPHITAMIDELYYQDNNDPSLSGIIKLVDDNQQYDVDVEKEILGQKEYTSSSNVKFTNGLKIRFGEDVVPAFYANEIFYIEGVGEAITLHKTSLFITPEPYIQNATEPYDTELYDSSGYEGDPNNPAKQDYVTINRGSVDGNAWSRSNRWFHIDVINAAAEYGNSNPIIDQSTRAQRPIIEFHSNFQLFNHCIVAREPIDLANTTELDAFSNVEGATLPYNIDGIPVTDGMRVIFTADNDEDVRHNIYNIKFIDPNHDDNYQIHLVSDDSELITAGVGMLVIKGFANDGKMFHYDGNKWIESLSKTALYQPPLFTVFDNDGNNLSNNSVYPTSTFTGTPIFSYATSNGPVDPILGISLKYRNFNSVGDIIFNNDFDVDTFSYVVDRIEKIQKVNIGFLRSTIDLENFISKNIWDTIEEESTQLQLTSYLYNSTHYYQIDILPAPESTIAYYNVYIDNKLLDRSLYHYEIINRINYVVIDESIVMTEDSKIDILIHSNDPSIYGWYQIPSNLENNAQNIIFNDLTLGQIRNHIGTVFNRSLKLTGVYPGACNLRDAQSSMTAGGNILQHSAGVPYASMFLLDEKANFMSAVTHAQTEYTRFKHKFLDLAIKLDFSSLGDINTLAVSNEVVDQIILFINQTKTDIFPWYASDMIPYGDDKIFTDATVISLIHRDYELTYIHDDNTLSNKAVLVYVNDVQINNKIDYVFQPDQPYITISKNYDLQVGDTVKIVEYSNTDGNWIPETPTKLGMYPLWEPVRFLDSTYITPTEVIRGHDGSITPVYGDFRDDLLLELEKRIHNNIKTEYNPTRFDVYDIIPGKFRNNDYSKVEFNHILSHLYYTFVGENKLADYKENDNFIPGNGFTYNYRKFVSVLDGEPLSGSWRAVFHYHYDTDRPHTHPWEMLGFTNEPAWWADRYGVAPYTSGNSILWDDLEVGKIYAGNRVGIDTNFVRPGLNTIIPVDQFGTLKSPDQFLATEVTVRYANESYSVGEEGIIETAWKRSSNYPFIMQAIIALSKPAKYFGLFADTQKYKHIAKVNQYLHDDTSQRLKQNDILINGEMVDSKMIRSASYLNWIADYVKSDGISPTQYVGHMIENFNIKLAYKVAGFTDKKFIKILAEQSSPSSNSSSILIPDENFDITLNKSSPLLRFGYSAVIVEKTTIGYKVSGYDNASPQFAIMPSIVNTNTTVISLLTDTVAIYNDFIKTPSIIPYGTEFPTKAALVDFLVSYGRWLERQGIIMDDYDDQSGEIRNWIMSSKEFLYWTQQGWELTSAIVLSPIGDTLKMNTPGVVVDEIVNTSPAKIIDQNFQPIKQLDFVAKRIDNNFTLRILNGQTIGYLEVSLVQYEHVLVFDNITVFNDILYQPELGNRQARVKLVGLITADWDGNLAPGGFIYNEDNVKNWQTGRDYKKGDIVQYKSNYYVAGNNLVGVVEFDYSNWVSSEYDQIKTGLLPNYATKADMPSTYYDIDNVNLDSQTDLFGKGLIGYRNRSYFNDLGLDDTSQVKFYQGFIKEKGTISSIEALTRAQFGQYSSDVDIYEEWALRVGEYGAIDSTQFIEVALDEEDYTANPSYLVFKNATDDSTIGAVNVRPDDIHDGPLHFSKEVFIHESNPTSLDYQVKTAGFPKPDQVDYMIYDKDRFAELDEYIYTAGVGQSIWIARDIDNDWDVVRITDINCNIIAVDSSNAPEVAFTTNNFHNLKVTDKILIRGVDKVVDGWYVITKIKDLNTFMVTVTNSLALFEDSDAMLGQLYKLISTRFNFTVDMANAEIDPLVWRNGEYIYIDAIDSDGNWGAIEKNSPWVFSNRDNALQVFEHSHYGSAVAITNPYEYVFVGRPQLGNGEIEIRGRTTSVYSASMITLTSPTSSSIGFGTSIAVQSGELLIVGAPNSISTMGNDAGQVCVYQRNPSGIKLYTLLQILILPGFPANALFGNTVIMSNDEQWIYVSSPGSNSVHTYAVKTSLNIDSYAEITSSVDEAPSFTLPFTPDSIDQMSITDNLHNFYIPVVDYTLVGDVVTFTHALSLPGSGSMQLQFKQLSTYVVAVNKLKMSMSLPDTDYALATDYAGSALTIGMANIYSEESTLYTASVQSDTDGVDYIRSSGGIAVDSQRNIVMSAYTVPNFFGMVVKLNSKFELLWSTGYGQPLIQHCHIITDSNDDIIVLESSDTFEPGLLVKYQGLTGDILWDREIHEDLNSRGLGIDANNNTYTIYHSTAGIGVGRETKHELVIIKVDTDGNKVWNKRWYDRSPSYILESVFASDIIVQPNGDFHVTGIQDHTDGHSLSYIAKFDTDGNILWQKTLSQDESGYVSPLAVDPISGSSYIIGQRSPYTSDMSLYKFDSDGNIPWELELDGTLSSDGSKILIDTDGNILIFGYAIDFYVIKVDPTGSVLWSSWAYGDTGSDVIYPNDVAWYDNENIVTVDTGDLTVTKIPMSISAVGQTCGGLDLRVKEGMTFTFHDTVNLINYNLEEISDTMTFDPSTVWTPVTYAASVTTACSFATKYITPGEVVVFDRSIESFVADGIQTEFNVEVGFDTNVIKVFVAGTLLTSDQFAADSVLGTVTLFDVPEITKIINIETNLFNEIMQLQPDKIYDNNQFGYGVAVCPTSGAIAVGMPNFDGSVPLHNNGKVYFYINQGGKFGSLLGTIQNPTVTIGDSIRINNITITFNDTGLASVITAINDANVPGVNAKDEDGYLRIISNSKVEFNKLIITPGADGTSTTLVDLGLEVYILADTIEGPIEKSNERFGETVIFAGDDCSLVVGSSVGTTYTTTTFDNNTTTFDGNSTRFGERETSSGSVNVYEYIPAINETINNLGRFILGQQLYGSDLSRYDRFGAAIAASKTMIVVGSPDDEYLNKWNTGEDAGSIYEFLNTSKIPCWNTTRTQQKRIDVSAINKVYLYSNKTKTIIQPLDYIDPIKGKVLGLAAQEINYMTSSDPASYSFSDKDNISSNESYNWSTEQIGKVWWDLSQVRCIEYEQDTVEFKALNWGKYFPGSRIDVYEWVDSDVIPSEYTNYGYNGTPKDIDDSLYTAIEFINPESNLPMTRYFFWVKDKTSVDNVRSKFRTMPVSRVTSLIANPKGQGIAYAEILDPSSIGLVNITSKLVSDDTILHVDYDIQRNQDVIHAEYALIQEGGNTDLPANVINRMVDSLSGINFRGREVPDSILPDSKKYGIDIRPRQSIFIDRSAALVSMIKAANAFLIQYRIMDIRKMPLMYTKEEPPVNTGAYMETVSTLEEFALLDIDSYSVGYKILILNNSSDYNFWTINEKQSNGTWSIIDSQSYDTTRFWNTVDWYADGYGDDTEIDVEVDGMINLHVLFNVVLGTIIKVNDNTTGKWELFKVEESGFVTIGVQNTTIQISELLYNPDTGSGYDSIGYDAGRYDQSPQEEIRRIMEALFNEILIDDLRTERNALFFIGVRQALSEQMDIDWIFKTSFISVNHAFSKLEEAPVYQRSDQTYLQDYINEVKPYRTKIREYLLNYEKLDNWNGDYTDFDLPSYYDTKLNRFRGPSGEQPKDEELLEFMPEYNQWQSFHGYVIDNIRVENGGSDYTDPPTVVISGGGGSGATAYCLINADGEVASIQLTNPGSGYISTPTVTIASTFGGQAVGYPYLSNATVRKIKTTIKFDRINYETNLVNWEPDTFYAVDTMVLYKDNPFRVTREFTTDSEGSFEIEYVELILAGEFDNANDRTWAYYRPTPGMIGRNLDQLFSGITYPGVEVIGPTFAGPSSVLPLDMEVDGGGLAPDYFDGTQPGQMEIDGSSFVDEYSAHAPEELVPGSLFETIDMQIFTAPENSTVPEMGYRMFQAMSGEISYYRIADENTTELSQSLLVDDTMIHVVDASVFARPVIGMIAGSRTTPGVIMINGERITFYGIGPTTENHPDFPNVPANALYQIWRGTQGTGTPQEHIAGLNVVDASEHQRVPQTENTRIDSIIEPWKVWTKIVNSYEDLQALNIDDYKLGAKIFVRLPQMVYTLSLVEETPELPEFIGWVRDYIVTDNVWYTKGVTTSTDGNGLIKANTAQAIFLRESPPFDPSLV